MTTFILICFTIWLWHSIGSEVVRVKYPLVFEADDAGMKEFSRHHLLIFLILGPVSWFQLILLRFQ